MAWAVKTRDLIFQRAGSRCERCGQYLTRSSGDYSIQHRRARGMGGSKRADTNSCANGVLLCGSATTRCHGFVESHPSVAELEGMRLAQWQDPQTVPVRLWRGWVLLDTEGGYTRLEEAS